VFLVAGIAALLTAEAFGPTDVETLAHLWPGVRDSTEQVFIGTEPNVTDWDEGADRRVRTVVAQMKVPWLGPHVLYLEEFLHDDPDNIRRQLLLQLEPAPPPAEGVQVHVYRFKDPEHWVHLDRRPRLLTGLQPAQMEAVSGCDLLLHRQGEQFIGGTTGRRCADRRESATRYVDYRLVIGDDLYWYRRRVLLKARDDLIEEVFGFNWFALDEARLFTCRVDWSRTGRRTDLRPLIKLDLHDEGGQARFLTPDGRKLELTLHSQDWPFMSDRDALILLLEDQDQATPLATAWTQIDSGDISINLGWLRVRCGSIAPDSDELWSQAASSPPIPPA